MRHYLSRQLPAHMIPSSFVMLEHLPLTTNGKVDRQLLAKLEQSSANPVHTDDNPRNPIETQLAVIWADLLGLEQVSIHANFFS